SVTAQTLTSTNPAASLISRTMVSLRAVGTLELFLGQPTQSIPAGARFSVTRPNSLFNAAPDLVKSIAKSIGVFPDLTILQFSSEGFNSAITSDGASIKETRKPSLMPSFLGRCVPEYPGMAAHILMVITAKDTKVHEGRHIR